MSSEKIDSLFSQELELYSDLDKLIAEYILPLQSDLLNLGSDLPTLKSDVLGKLQQKQQEIRSLLQEQIQEMRLLYDDANFKIKHPLFFQFISQSIDFSELPDPNTQCLCYLSIYKLLSTIPGTALISNLCHHLATIKQKIIMHPTEDDSMEVKELNFYHPNIDRCNHQYVSAGNQFNLVSRLTFISFGHELIHLLHHLLDFTFPPTKEEDDDKEKERKAKESKRYFKFFLTQPKRWLYTGILEAPEFSKKPHEYITIEGRKDLLNGLCENSLRAAYGLASRKGWRGVSIKDGSAKLNQYFFLTKKLAKEELLTIKEQGELRLSKANGTLPEFLLRYRNKAKEVESTIEALENTSTCSYCSIL